MVTGTLAACLAAAFSILAALSEARLPPSTDFIRTRDNLLLLHGSPFFFSGFNAYWLMHVAAEPVGKTKIADVFRDAAGKGLTVCRTWAFSDGGDRALQISSGVYYQHVFQALNFVVSEARKCGIRLILSLVNNYADFGGRAQYVKWAREAGSQADRDDDFYNNPTIKLFYKNHVKTVLTRLNTLTKVTYMDDQTIMAWELINEPRSQADSSGDMVHKWVQEMVSYTKSTDKRHLLEIGMEGFYGDSTPEKKQNNPGYQVGTDFIRSNLLPEVDFATIHAYPDAWLPGQNEDVQQAFMQRWMLSHSTDSRSILKKPLVVTEFGVTKKDLGSTSSIRDNCLNMVYNIIYNSARRTRGVSGGLVWQILAEGMDPYDDGYEIILPEDYSTNEVIRKHSHQMTTLSQIMTTTST